MIRTSAGRAGRLTSLGMSVLLIVAAGCSSSQSAAPVSPPATVRTPGSQGSVLTAGGPATGLPAGEDLTPVEVTRPATPSSVDPSELPPRARSASAMAGLTTDQRICIDDTIARTVHADPTIADDQGRLAGVIGSALAVCAGDAFTGPLIDGLVSTVGLSSDEAQCLRQQLHDDPAAAARLLGAIATTSLAQIDDALSEFEDACGFTVGG